MHFILKTVGVILNAVDFIVTCDETAGRAAHRPQVVNASEPGCPQSVIFQGKNLRFRLKNLHFYTKAHVDGCVFSKSHSKSIMNQR